MIKDFLDVENAEGMPHLADGTIALDFLLSAKNGVINYAMALTEVTHPQVREILINQLRSALLLHREITDLMMKKGWLHPYNLSEQIQLDTTSSDMALMIAGLELFPGPTDRLGTFATPKY